MDVFIYGEISPYALDASAAGLRYALRGVPDTEPLTVRVHSPGGSPFEASAIRAILEQRKAPVTIAVDGLAASAAAHLLCTQGARVEMSDGAWAMIHRTSTFSDGEADDLERDAKQLRAIDTQTAELFARRTGKSAAEMAKAMAETTWLDARAAVNAGFADAITERPAVLQMARFGGEIFESAPDATVQKWSRCQEPCKNIPMALDPVKIRQSLGLPANASDDDVFKALDKAQQITSEPVAPAATPAEVPDVAALVEAAVTKALAGRANVEAHSLAVQTAVDAAIVARKVRPADRTLAIGACGKDAEQLARQVAYWNAAPALVNDPATLPAVSGANSIVLTPRQKAMAKSAGISEDALKAQIAQENAK